MLWRRDCDVWGKVAVPGCIYACRCALDLSVIMCAAQVDRLVSRALACLGAKVPVVFPSAVLPEVAAAPLPHPAGPDLANHPVCNIVPPVATPT
jgi:hypothetical protein